MPYFITMPARNGGYWVRFDYDPEMISRLKRLPVDCRRWEPEMRAWWIHDGWIETAKSLLNDSASYADYRRCDNHWQEDDPEEERRDRERGRAREQERARSREREQEFHDWYRQHFSGHQQHRSGAATKDRATADCFAKLYLLPTAPPGVVTAAWRALSRIHHPDVGGSTERMKEINLAYEEALRLAEGRAKSK